MQPNGDIQYVIQVKNEYGELFWKRCPKHLLDQIRGREILSDVALFSDIDMRQPSIQEVIARSERVGIFTGDLTDDEFDDDDYVTEFEERAQEAIRQVQELRLKQSKDFEDKRKDLSKDMSSERVNAHERLQSTPEDVKQLDEA